MKKLALVMAVLMIFTCTSALADFHETNLPITDEKYEFSMMIDDSGYPEDKIIYNMLEEQTNVHVNLNLAPYALQVEKLGIALNTGDYADVIAGWLLGTKDIIDLGMGDQTFLPLEDLIAKYAPNIEEVLNIPGVRESMTLPDGHIYCIPYVVGEPEATFKPYINQVWLERVGMEMPTTPEELKAVLIAFRDQDANGNGDPSDEIPFSGDPNNLSLGMLAGWWGVDANSGNSDYPYFALVDGKIQFNANKPEYKQFIEFFADLYKEKLIDPEIFTQDLETWKAKGKQDLYGVSIDMVRSLVDGLFSFRKVDLGIQLGQGLLRREAVVPVLSCRRQQLEHIAVAPLGPAAAHSAQLAPSAVTRQHLRQVQMRIYFLHFHIPLF